MSDFTHGTTAETEEWQKYRAGKELQIQRSVTKVGKELQIEWAVTKVGKGLQIEWAVTKVGKELEIEWAVTKVVSDLTHGTTAETEEWQKFGSEIAASVVHNLFKNPLVLKAWTHYEDAKGIVRQ